MGFTRHWRTTRDLTDREWGIITEMFFYALPHYFRYQNDINPVEYEEHLGIEVGRFDTDILMFNGVASGGHEDFVVMRSGVGYGFCKTAEKPYDVFVGAMLIVIASVAGDAWNIKADGDDDLEEFKQNWMLPKNFFTSFLLSELIRKTGPHKNGRKFLDLSNENGRLSATYGEPMTLVGGDDAA